VTNKLQDEYYIASKVYMQCAGYMHIDYWDGQVAAVGGDGLYVWVIQDPWWKLVDRAFLMSEISVPKTRSMAFNDHPNVHPRTIHFLHNGNAVIVSFAEVDISQARSFL
jgi:hypothetical protein